MILLAVFVLHSQTTQADTYITFDNGQVYVFPESCLSKTSSTVNKITFTALDGSVYSYTYSDISAIGKTPPRKLPTITSFVFDKKYNYQVINDVDGVIEDNLINAQVLGIGKWLTATFTLSDNRAAAYVDGKEQESSVSRISFKTSRNYTVGFRGDLILAEVETGKYGLVPYGREYTVNVYFPTDNSIVPRIDINTKDGVDITSKEYYLDAEIIIDGGGIFPSMTDSVQVKGRGNSFLNDPTAKNPYRLKFKEKTKPLGLKKGKNWVLLANKKPGSMMTNAIGLKAGSLLGAPAPNHIIPVDLYVNGTYKGNYNFTEKVGLSNNSVDLDDETVATLLELDLYYDEVESQKFMSTPYRLRVNVKEPDFSEQGSTQLTLAMIKQRFNSFAAAVKDDTELADHVDIDYLARFLMINELICNYEIFHPKSTFCYNENLLNDSCKFIFGPIWDCDFAFGYETLHKFFYCDPAIDFYTAVNMEQQEFMTKLRYNSKVSKRMYYLWKEFVEKNLDELCDFCGEYYEFAKQSLQQNRTVWDDDRINYSFQAQLAENWLRNRAMALLTNILIEESVPGDVDDNGEITISDVTALINYLLTRDAYGINTYAADVNCDGEVTISDVTALINILLDL